MPYPIFAKHQTRKQQVGKFMSYRFDLTGNLELGTREFHIETFQVSPITMLYIL